MKVSTTKDENAGGGWRVAGYYASRRYASKPATCNLQLATFLLIALLLVACGSAPTTPEPTPILHTYAASDESILNPERGFFTPYELPGSPGFSPIRATGNTLVHLNIRLDEWREAPLSQELLDGLAQNFADLRSAGIKAILRVAYNNGPYPDSEPDASKTWILQHITQLKPVLQSYGDVIAWVEAGFIGAWGEWHTSTNGLANLTDKRDILQALLAALPANRIAQVRYPADIIEMYSDPAAAVAARVGHHNDCFLSSDTDVGTYENDGEVTIVRDQAYLTQLTAHTPMSGESCAPNPPRSECPSAIHEMELLHVSALNEAYHKAILRSWQRDGCFAEINNRLGYRLLLQSATFNEEVRPGGILAVSVKLTNQGFAAPVNPRPLLAVLSSADQTYSITLPIDPRSWQPGDLAFTVALALPSAIPEDEYILALWLPDASPILRNNPAYAIRFANQETWDERDGTNRLGTVVIDDSVTGSFDSQNGKLTVLNETGQ